MVAQGAGIRITAVGGSVRERAYTAAALAVVTAALESAGAAVESFDPRQLRLAPPGSDPDDPEVLRLRESIANATGVVLATPEYHGTFASMTKMILENMGFPSALKDKPMALLGVAQGRIGAIKSLEHLRGACSHMGAIVVPATVSVAGIQNAFKDGSLTDVGVRGALESAATSLLQFLHNYVCPKYVLEAMVRDESENASVPWTATL
jgi:NAD(P)H-dependent FMN reductase